MQVLIAIHCWYDSYGFIICFPIRKETTLEYSQKYFFQEAFFFEYFIEKFFKRG